MTGWVTRKGSQVRQWANQHNVGGTQQTRYTRSAKAAARVNNSSSSQVQANPNAGSSIVLRRSTVNPPEMQFKGVADDGSWIYE